jgi:hypothetical protein
MGMPLNTEVKDGGSFTREYSKHWGRLMKAHSVFIRAILVYSGLATRAGWKQVKKSFKALRQEAKHCDDYLCKLLNVTNGEPKPKTELDMVQACVLGYFLKERAIPFLDFFQGIIAKLEGGEAASFRGEDVPLWTDPE